jgi:hypothetical protein
MKFRNDVAVINRYLLQLEPYSKAVYKRYPSIKPKGQIQAVESMDKGKDRLQKMVDDDDINVHFAPSVNFSTLDLSLDLVTDGLTQRSAKKGLTRDEAAALFLETYRLDSATDWNFAWDLVPSVSHLLSNYVISIIHIAQDASVSEEKRSKLLAKAMEIAEFHDMERLAITVKSMQKREK